MKNNYLPMLLTDFYKISHREQYPVGTQKVYSTWTCRSSRMEGVNHTVFFGLQKFIKEYLIDYFKENFFDKDINEITKEYKKLIKLSLGKDVDTTHIENLHKLGYLPIKITALPEGTLVPIKVPCFTIENTIDEFYWVTNFLETLLSCELWQPITSATISLEFRKIVEEYSNKTCNDNSHIDFQCHDFSMRGMQSLGSSINSGMGHLLNFKGTDTIPAIMGVQKYYNMEDKFVASSIPATEHSVMCSYGQTNELELLEHLMTNVYPNGFFSVVCDTWDFWKVIGEYLPKLKNTIMNRDGRTVIRPDSGNPIDIICGIDNKEKSIYEQKGLIECLWDIFGGTVNEKGYKVLDSHIGAIYGDGITLERAKTILDKLEKKGFASSNIVFGVGSFTYVYNTRDTFGQALKSTYAIVNNEERLLFKDPKTDDGTKKSQKGMIIVYKENNEIKYKDGFVKETIKDYEKENLLRTVFKDGNLLIDDNFEDIKKNRF